MLCVLLMNAQDLTSLGILAWELGRCNNLGPSLQGYRTGTYREEQARVDDSRLVALENPAYGNEFHGIQRLGRCVIPRCLLCGGKKLDNVIVRNKPVWF
jgi:hypothetical protein